MESPTHEAEEPEVSDGALMSLTWQAKRVKRDTADPKWV